MFLFQSIRDPGQWHQLPSISSGWLVPLESGQGGSCCWYRDQGASSEDIQRSSEELCQQTFLRDSWGTILWGLPTTRDIYRWLSDSHFDKPGPKKRGVYCFTMVVSIRMSICNTFLSNFKSEVLIHVQNELNFWPHLMLSSISKLLIILFIHIKAGVSLVSMSHSYVVNSVDFSN